jgi:hypothetical protein
VGRDEGEIGFGTVSTELHAEAQKAIKETGTNALPYLLKWIQSERVPLRYKLPAWTRKFRARYDSIDSFFRTRSEMRIEGAMYSFRHLGTNITSIAVPELTRFIITAGQQTTDRATELLAYSGEAGITKLATVLEARTHPNQDSAVLALWHVDTETLGPSARRLVPGMANCRTNTTNRLIAMIAAETLNKIDSPELAVPALQSLLLSSEPWRRCVSASSATCA